jgi:transposase
MQWLTHMHTGDRSAGAVDAGCVLPGYQGILVRDGYHGGYGHLTGALHAWCGAHLLRDLKGLYEFEPGKQDWARQMAALLLEVRDAARDARAGGKKALDLDIFTNEAERTIRPVKVAQRAFGGCWRTLDGLADFAVVQSYLSTAAKWGITKIEALCGLFNGTPWMPPDIETTG